MEDRVLTLINEDWHRVNHRCDVVGKLPAVVVSVEASIPVKLIDASAEPLNSCDNLGVEAGRRNAKYLPRLPCRRVEDNVPRESIGNTDIQVQKVEVVQGTDGATGYETILTKYCLKVALFQMNLVSYLHVKSTTPV